MPRLSPGRRALFPSPPGAAATSVVALDCEMVGVGPGGERSSLARACVVNNDGVVLLDAYVAQKERVTDYRTRYSGITPELLVGAPPLEEVQKKVAALLDGRILVGHALHNDLTALMLSHPRAMMRDTSRYGPLMREPRPGRKPKPKALRVLAAEELGLTIQEGSHSPVDDARAALYLYHKHRREWEAAVRAGQPGGTALGAAKAAKAAKKAARMAAAVRDDHMADR